jgi:hypothetical protein
MFAAAAISLRATASLKVVGAKSGRERPERKDLSEIRCRLLANKPTQRNRDELLSGAKMTLRSFRGNAAGTRAWQIGRGLTTGRV